MCRENRSEKLERHTRVNCLERVTKEKFSDWIQENKTQMYFFTVCIVKNEADAEDVVCDAIVKVYKHLDKLHDAAELKSLFMNILYQNAKALYLKRKRDKTFRETKLFLTDSADTGKELWRAILKLDTKLQAVAVLYYYIKYGIEDIAQILQISEKTVRSRLDKVRGELRVLVET